MLQIKIVFKGMDHSLAFEEYVQKETKKLEKFLQKELPCTLDVVAESVHGNQSFFIEMRLHSQHYHLIAHYTGNDVYKTYTDTLDILEGEIKKAKQKMIDDRDKVPDPWSKV